MHLRLYEKQENEKKTEGSEQPISGMKIRVNWVRTGEKYTLQGKT